MGFNSKRFISTRYFSSTLLFLPPYRTRKCVEEIKVGVVEKKKTQGMRRNLGHEVCGRSQIRKQMLTFCDAWFADIDRDLATICGADEFCKAASVITVHLQCVGEFLLGQISQVKTEQFLCKRTIRTLRHH